jgi:hypothetical protein
MVFQLLVPALTMLFKERAAGLMCDGYKLVYCRVRPQILWARSSAATAAAGTGSEVSSTTTRCSSSARWG